MQSNTPRWKRPAPERPLPLFDSLPAAGGARQTADCLPQRKGAAEPRRPPFSTTSRAARQSVAHAAAYVEQRILDYLAECGPRGATADEVTVALDLAPSSATGRLSELTAAGKIVRAAATRPTRRGRAAHVHLHPKHAKGNA